MGSEKKHFVLVHGSGLGAWSWYKVVALLKKEGHLVTALDLGGCGINPKQIDQLPTIYDYIQPLTNFIASIPDDEKVILVGHSYGGFPIALTTERFPNKISVGVYVTAYMPNVTSPPVTQLQEFFNRSSPGSLLDCDVRYDNGPQNPPTSILFGPTYLTVNVYQKSPPEDLELAKVLVRRNGFYFEDLSKKDQLTQGKYGSVTRVFVLTTDDRVLPKDFQKYIIDNSPPKDVEVILGSDHMAMQSKPTQLYLAFLEIAKKYG